MKTNTLMTRVGSGLILALTVTVTQGTEDLQGTTTINSLTGDPGNLLLEGSTIFFEGGFPQYNWGEMYIDYDWQSDYARYVTMSSEGYGGTNWAWGSHTSSGFSPQMELKNDGSFSIVGKMTIDTSGVLKLLGSSYYGSPKIELNPGGAYSTPPPSIKIGGQKVLTTADASSVFLPALPNNAMVLSGSSGTGTVPATGAGTRLMWYPGKSAFRAGQVTSNQWDEANVGVSSIALGYNTRSSGGYSVSMGNTTVASGVSSTAMGQNSTASGTASTALGRATASGSYSVATGYLATASGSYSTALGWQSTASGYGSMALGGNKSTASGHGSFAMGIFADAVPLASIAMGYGNAATGTSTVWIEDEPLFDLGNAEVNPLSPTVPTTRSSAITTLKNGRTLLTNKAWKAHVDAFGNPLQDPSASADSGGDALVVEGHTRLKGKILIEPQGDLSMSGFEVGEHP